MSSPRRPRVLYFGVHDPGYPRNQRIRQYLESRFQAQVDILPAQLSGGRWYRYSRQLWAAVTAKRDYDVVVLAEFSNHFFFASWLAAKLSRAVHVVDFFVGLYETQIGDWHLARPGSMRARALRLADRLVLLTADQAFTDTEPRAERFSHYVWNRREILALPVGPPPWVAKGRPKYAAPRPHFLYYGNYLPLHGLHLFIDAFADALKEVDCQLTLIGTGGLRDTVEPQVRRRIPSDRFEFLNPVDESTLADYLASCDVVVGVFGSSPKAIEVVPNKVWQGLAAGRTVLTRDGTALAQLTELVGERLRAVSPERESLRRAIASLANEFSCPQNKQPAREGVYESYTMLEQWVGQAFDRSFECSALVRRLGTA